MWRAIGLKQDQIARMVELRAQYPAVVNGQWVVVEDASMTDDEKRSQAVPNASTSVSGPASRMSGSGTNTLARTPQTAVRSTGLQHELRAVLTPVQLKRWAQRCVY